MDISNFRHLWDVDLRLSHSTTLIQGRFCKKRIFRKLSGKFNLKFIQEKPRYRCKNVTLIPYGFVIRPGRYFANNVNTDETAHHEPSHQDIHRLPICSWFTTVTLLGATDVSKYRDGNSGLKGLFWLSCIHYCTFSIISALYYDLCSVLRRGLV